MRTTVVFAVVLAFAALGAPTSAGARVYWEMRPLLGDFFKKSQRVAYMQVRPSDAERTRVERRLARPLKRKVVTFYYGVTGGVADGYAIVDDEIGQHQPITFATKLTPRGEVERVEIVAYREPYGEGVASPTFLAQFRGKSARDRLQVDVVSGATVSSRSMQVGVRRALVLFEELLAPRLGTAVQRVAPSGVR